ncbi:hypothetical protein BDC45DRAFT_461904 [Circinella umbellata]|nr:hypothetical protein BDC45DRAFT_461904 [Circinella umbellata]
MGVHGVTFDSDLELPLKKIIKNTRLDMMTRTDAIIDLLTLSKTTSTINAKIVKSVANMIDKLPPQRLKGEIKEFELCSRYIDPILSALFDDPHNGVLFRWTSTTNREAKDARTDGSISAQRPDSCVSELDQLYFGNSLGYVEVKPASEKANKYAVSKDLIRLGIMTKNSCDYSRLNACMAIQVIDTEISFYITRLRADGLYLFSELCTIKAPSSLEDLGIYLNYLDDIASVLSCFKKWCVHMSSEEAMNATSKRRMSLSDEQFGLLSHSKSNKRRSVTMH